MNAIARITQAASRVPAATANRITGLLVALPTSIVLGLSAWLQPSPEGFGTHQQLGLAGCTMLTVTGWPCPMCGMTTTFAHLAHFHLVDAFFTQPFGLVLFSGTVIFALVGWADVATGRGFLERTLARILRRERTVALTLLFGMAGGWIYKMVTMHPQVFGL